MEIECEFLDSDGEFSSSPSLPQNSEVSSEEPHNSNEIFLTPEDDSSYPTFKDAIGTQSVTQEPQVLDTGTKQESDSNVTSVSSFSAGTNPTSEFNTLHTAEEAFDYSTVPIATPDTHSSTLEYATSYNADTTATADTFIPTLDLTQEDNTTDCASNSIDNNSLLDFATNSPLSNGNSPNSIPSTPNPTNENSIQDTGDIPTVDFSCQPQTLVNDHTPSSLRILINAESNNQTQENQVEYSSNSSNFPNFIPQSQTLNISYEDISESPTNPELAAHSQALNISYEDISEFPTNPELAAQSQTLNISYEDISESPTNPELAAQSQTLNISYEDISESPTNPELAAHSQALNISYEDISEFPTNPELAAQSQTLNISYEDISESPTNPELAAQSQTLNISYEDISESPTNPELAAQSQTLNISYEDISESPTNHELAAQSQTLENAIDSTEHSSPPVYSQANAQTLENNISRYQGYQQLIEERNSNSHHYSNSNSRFQTLNSPNSNTGDLTVNSRQFSNANSITKFPSFTEDSYLSRGSYTSKFKYFIPIKTNRNIQVGARPPVRMKRKRPQENTIFPCEETEVHMNENPQFPTESVDNSASDNPKFPTESIDNSTSENPQFPTECVDNSASENPQFPTECVDNSASENPNIDIDESILSTLEDRLQSLAAAPVEEDPICISSDEPDNEPDLYTQIELMDNKNFDLNIAIADLDNPQPYDLDLPVPDPTIHTLSDSEPVPKVRKPRKILEKITKRCKSKLDPSFVPDMTESSDVSYGELSDSNPKPKKFQKIKDRADVETEKTYHMEERRVGRLRKYEEVVVPQKVRSRKRRYLKKKRHAPAHYARLKEQAIREGRYFPNLHDKKKKHKLNKTKCPSESDDSYQPDLSECSKSANDWISKPTMRFWSTGEMPYDTTMQMVSSKHKYFSLEEHFKTPYLHKIKLPDPDPKHNIEMKIVDNGNPGKACYTPAQGLRMMNADILADVFGKLNCPLNSCKGGKLKLYESTFKHGMQNSFVLFCSYCGNIVTKFCSSRQLDMPVDQNIGLNIKLMDRSEVNVRAMLGVHTTSLTWRGFRKFANIMDLPTPTTVMRRSEQMKFAEIVLAEVDESMRKWCKYITDSEGAVKSVRPGCVEVAVSFDGSWKQRGHYSNVGFAAVIERESKKVVDYELLNRNCEACSKWSTHMMEKQPEEYEAWFKAHKPHCKSNFSGTSLAMESEAAVRMWKRSEGRGLVYKVFIGDGDGSGYKSVLRSGVYNGEVKIEKEECIGHLQKRLKNHLMKATKSTKNSTYVKHSLEEHKADRVAHLFAVVVGQHVGKPPEEMSNSLWRMLGHISENHDDCPPGPGSYCLYQKQLYKHQTDPSTNAPKTRRCYFTDIDLEKIREEFETYASVDVCSHLTLGATQNINESLHSCIWSSCLKTKYASPTCVSISVALSVLCFNEGQSALVGVLLALGIKPSINSIKEFVSYDKVRMYNREFGKSDQKKAHRRQRKIDSKNREMQRRKHDKAASRILYQSDKHGVEVKYSAKKSKVSKKPNNDKEDNIENNVETNEQDLKIDTDGNLIQDGAENDIVDAMEIEIHDTAEFQSHKVTSTNQEKKTTPIKPKKITESKPKKTTEPKQQKTTEPKEKKTTEPKEKKTTEPKEKKTTEPKEKKTTEPKEKKTTEPKEKKTTEPKEKKTTEPKEKKTTEPKEKKTTEPKEKKTTEPKEKKTTEPKEKKTTEPKLKKTTEPKEKKTTEPKEKKTTEPKEKKTTEPKEKKTTEPKEKKTTEPKEKKTTEPKEKKTTEPKEKKTTEPKLKKTTEPKEKKTTEPKEKKTTEPKEKKTTGIESKKSKSDTQEQNVTKAGTKRKKTKVTDKYSESGTEDEDTGEILKKPKLRKQQRIPSYSEESNASYSCSAGEESDGVCEDCEMRVPGGLRKGQWKWIGCEKCQKWFHDSCLSIQLDDFEDEDFICKACS